YTNNTGGGVIQGNGTLDVSTITFTNAGIIAPGASPGTLIINGDLNLVPTSIIDIELGGLVQGTEYDLIDVTGDANLDGTMNVTLFGGFTPASSDSFEVIKCAGICSGSFGLGNVNVLQDFGSVVTTVITGPPGNVTLDVTALLNKWIGAVDDFWKVAGNWSLSAVPTLDHDVLIDNSIDVVTPTVFIENGIAAEANSLNTLKHIDIQDGSSLTVASGAALGGNLKFSDGTANFNGSSSVTGTLDILKGTLTAPLLTSVTGAVTIGGGGSFNTGTLDIDTDITFASLNMTGSGSSVLTGDANITVSGAFTASKGGPLFDSVTISTTGITTLQSGGNINLATGGGGFNLQNGELENQDLLVWMGSDAIAMSAGAVLTNALGATFDVQTDENITGTATEQLNNLGVLQKSSSGGGSTDINVPFDNSGLVDVQSGTLALNGGGTHASGSFSVSGSETLKLAGGHVADVTTGFGGSGTLDLGSGINTLGGPFTFTGHMINSGTNTITDTVAINTLSVNDGSLDLPNATTIVGALNITRGAVTAPNLTSVGGAVAIGGSSSFNTASLDIDTNISFISLDMSGGGDSVLTGSADVTVVGAFNAVKGGPLFDTVTISGTGKTTLQSGGTINTATGGGSFQLQNGELENQGILTWQGSDPLQLSGGAVFTNTGGATFEIQADQSISGGGGEQFNNLGTVQKSAGVGTTVVSVSFDNDGITDVDSGILQLNNPFINDGSIDVVAGTTFMVNGATFVNAATGIIQGDGAITTPAGLTGLDNFGAINAGTSPGTLTINGNLTLNGTSVINIELGG
ncbi:MAG: hypothetical protein GY731_00520, partial [Gammaproteobacteria bacterium]|nr:hypothetical protein [Gammaproteobacteria bacterium]